MPFDSHLLIPLSPDYIPLPTQVLTYFERLIEIGILSPQPEITLRLPTEEEIYVHNANTGERIATGLKRLKDAPVTTLAQCEICLSGTDQYFLSTKSCFAVLASPFDLRNKDGSEADQSKTCEMTVSCVVRDRRTQLSEQWHEHLRIFLLPQEMWARACPECGAIHEPEEEVQPRFWIEFAFNGVYLSNFQEASREFDPTLYAMAQQAFQTHFFHGRFFD